MRISSGRWEGENRTAPNLHSIFAIRLRTPPRRFQALGQCRSGARCRRAGRRQRPPTLRGDPRPCNLGGSDDCRHRLGGAGAIPRRHFSIRCSAPQPSMARRTTKNPSRRSEARIGAMGPARQPTPLNPKGPVKKGGRISARPRVTPQAAGFRRRSRHRPRRRDRRRGRSPQSAPPPPRARSHIGDRRPSAHAR